jgi:TPR repeat protein
MNGIGVHIDMSEAARYFKLAADSGDTRGQCAFGRCLENGLGVPANWGEAVRYLQSATNKGDPEGKKSLEGISRDSIAMHGGACGIQ